MTHPILVTGAAGGTQGATGRQAASLWAPEDFETIARRYAGLPGNQRNFGNWLRAAAQFLITPLSPGFNLERYDRELRAPFPSEPQLAGDSKVWRLEHAVADAAKPAAAARATARTTATGRVPA